MDDMKFEQALKALEDIVESIESGKLDLDESIKLFEEGMRLSAYCQNKLQMADAKIKYLISDEESGELNLQDEP